MMSEKEICCGNVEAVEAGFARVLLSGGADGEECARCGCCAGEGKGRKVRVRAKVGELKVRAGQRVSVRRTVTNPALAAGIVFGLPLAGMLGLIVVTIAFGAPAESPLVVAAAGGGLVTGGIVAWLVDRTVFRRDPPVVLEVLG